MCAECERLRGVLNTAMDALEALMEEEEDCSRCAHDRGHLGCALVEKYGDDCGCTPLWKGRASV